MTKHDPEEITIGADSQGNIRVSPNVKRVRRGTGIQWRAEAYHIKVSFLHGSPFGIESPIHAQAAPGGLTETLSVAADAQKRAYRYSVILARVTEDRVVELFGDPGCPVIIVE